MMLPGTTTQARVHHSYALPAARMDATHGIAVRSRNHRLYLPVALKMFDGFSFEGGGGRGLCVGGAVRARGLVLAEHRYGWRIGREVEGK